jgi:hypothetical protein
MWGERQLRQIRSAVTSKMNLLVQARKEKESGLGVMEDGKILIETDTPQTTKSTAVVPIARTTTRAAAKPMLNAVRQRVEISTMMITNHRHLQARRGPVKVVVVEANIARGGNRSRMVGLNSCGKMVLRHSISEQV